MKRTRALLFNFFVFVIVAFSEPNDIGCTARMKVFNSQLDRNVQINFRIHDVDTEKMGIWKSGNQSIKLSSGIFSYNIKTDETKVDWRKKIYGCSWLQREESCCQGINL